MYSRATLSRSTHMDGFSESQRMATSASVAKDQMMRIALRQRGNMRVRPTTLLGIALALSLNVLVILAGATVAAADPPAETAEPQSLLGSYLAGRLAAKDLDHGAAATFYDKLLQQDPENPT